MDNYLIGLYLGDGFISHQRTNKNGSKYYRFGICCHEDNVKYILSVVPGSHIYRTYKAKGSVNYTYHEVLTHNQEFILELLDLCGNLENKKLPKDIDFLEVFAGLIDSDGTVSKDNLRFLNTNRSLCEDVKERLTQLGISTTLRSYRQTNRKHKPINIVHINQRSIKELNVDLKLRYKSERLIKLKTKK